MPRPSDPGSLPPPWLLAVGSALVVLHLGAVGLHALAASSGPWPMDLGGGMVPPPQFAATTDAHTLRYYLQPIKLTHNYHFLSNRPGGGGWEAYLEVRLKDDQDRDVKTVRIPDPDANPWVRHRQELLVRWMTEDEPATPQGTERIPAPRKGPDRIQVWDRKGNLAFQEVNLLPRDQLVLRPSDWAMLLARSYTRYLCRVHGAEKAEVVRHARRVVPVDAMLLEVIPPELTTDQVSNFGEFSK